MQDMLKSDVVYFATPSRDYQFWADYLDNLINDLDN